MLDPFWNEEFVCLYDCISNECVGVMNVCWWWIVGEFVFDVVCIVLPFCFVVISEGVFEVSFFDV